MMAPLGKIRRGAVMEERRPGCPDRGTVRSHGGVRRRTAVAISKFVRIPSSPRDDHVEFGLRYRRRTSSLDRRLDRRGTSLHSDPHDPVLVFTATVV
jgi:hypothetical protein